MPCPSCNAPNGTPHTWQSCLPINMRTAPTHPFELLALKERYANKIARRNKKLATNPKGEIRRLNAEVSALRGKMDNVDRLMTTSVKYHSDMAKFNVLADRLNEDVAGLIMRFATY